MSKNVTVSQLHSNHPARSWAGLWERLSLLTPSGPIVMDSEKILIPVGQQIESAIILYGMTHGSRPHMIETLGKYMFWRNWKKQIQQVADACETCNTLLPSQSNGKPRNNKLSLSKLQLMDCIHIDQFECQGKQFLAVKDYMSTFTWMMRLTATDINHVLK